jgi:hypothetical protein
MTGHHQRPSFTRRAAGLFIAGACALAASSPAISQPVSLEGSWSGGGTVIFPSGSREKARCRATFRRQSSNQFAMNAVCATASGRIAQTAGLARTSANRFSGGFYNAEYAVSGSIAITVHGNRLNASLNGGGASAHLSLSR